MAMNTDPGNPNIAAGAPPGRIDVAVEGDIATVTLDHPGRLNALTVDMWNALHGAFDALSADSGLRCIVLRGAGGNFAAGADIREFPRERAGRERVMHYHRQIIAPALAAIRACAHPVVAMIEGVCVGGGLEVASQCDLRIAGRSARFGVPINRLGFPLAPDEMLGLLGLVGKAVTLEILLEGRIFDAAEAQAKGLLTRVVPDEAVADEVARSVRRIARGAPLAARLNRRMAARLAAGPEPLTEAELLDFFDYADSHDHRHGIEAFLAGREPEFTGE